MVTKKRWTVRVTRGLHGKCVNYASFTSKKKAAKKAASLHSKTYWASVWVARASTPCRVPPRVR